MQVTTTYLEMHSHQHRDVPPPRAGLTVMQARNPTVAFYRFIYNAVGEEWHWGRCKRMSDDELKALIQNPQMEVHILYVDGVPAGFAEFDRRTPGEVELLQFGLTADFIGQGLGRYFLQWVIDKAWSYAPNRLWLHTCTLDHPGAIPNYVKAGFVPYKEETAERKL